MFLISKKGGPIYLINIFTCSGKGQVNEYTQIDGIFVNSTASVEDAKPATTAIY